MPADKMQLYLHDSAEAFTLRILGSVHQSDLTELEGCWRTAQSIISGKAFIIDVGDLVFADEGARGLLLLMRNSGARLRGASANASEVLGDNIIDKEHLAHTSKGILHRASLHLRAFLKDHAPHQWSITNLPERS